MKSRKQQKLWLKLISTIFESFHHPEPMQPVTDPADWTGADLERNKDWQFTLTDAEIQQLVDKAIANAQKHHDAELRS